MYIKDDKDRYKDIDKETLIRILLARDEEILTLNTIISNINGRNYELHKYSWLN